MVPLLPVPPTLLFEGTNVLSLTSLFASLSTIYFSDAFAENIFLELSDQFASGSLLKSLVTFYLASVLIPTSSHWSPTLLRSSLLSLSTLILRHTLSNTCRSKTPFISVASCLQVWSPGFLGFPGQPYCPHKTIKISGKF